MLHMPSGTAVYGLSQILCWCSMELRKPFQPAAAQLMMFWCEQQRGMGKMSKVWLAVSSLPPSTEASLCDSLVMCIAAHI